MITKEPPDRISSFTQREVAAKGLQLMRTAFLGIIRETFKDNSRRLHRQVQSFMIIVVVKMDNLWPGYK